MSIKAFIIENHEKKMTIQTYIYSAYYRFMIKYVSMKEIEKKMGIRGKETPYDESIENYKYAALVRFHVSRVTTHTPWKSKCYVQALTARKLLEKHGIPSTIYMGVMESEEGLKAHAWLRCGKMCVTGEDYGGFSVVAKFANDL